MESLWQDKDAQHYLNDPLQMRVYSSRLLGQDASLVLHGGGNTSVKAQASNLFGDQETVLYVKGSGWDLASIEKAGFAPVRLNTLQRMAQLEQLSDTDMVNEQRAAMLNPNAPNPSVEAILHAIIPFKYVDHTHADAVVALTNTPDSSDLITELYGKRVLIIPYIMPGFELARQVAKITAEIDWSTLDGMILMNHGVFSFSDDAKTSYETMLKLVSIAEDYLQAQQALRIAAQIPEVSNLQQLADIRKAVSELAGRPMLACLDNSAQACGFASLPDVAKIACQGPLTPDHVIRTKRIPMLVTPDTQADAQAYQQNYQQYFQTYASPDLSCLSPEPRWAVWPLQGTLSFGSSLKETRIIGDIVSHTRKAIQWAENLSSWQSLPAKDIFAMEYWELEQAKLGKSNKRSSLQGKIALVTGAANGIGKACVEALQQNGATVVAVDINPVIKETFKQPDILGIACDLTDSQALQSVVDSTVSRFGGLDILISNAGTFPPSVKLANMDEKTWQQSMAINLTSHQQLLTACQPYLKRGIDPAVVFIASKKAGMTQLARIAALEMGADGIRVNVLHPNAVFDTAIWTDDILASRAAHYGLSVQAYKTNNLLHQEVTSKDVAELACAMVGPLFAKTTGAQLPIDGGNERVV